MNFSEIKTIVSNQDSDNYYPLLLKRYKNLDPTLTSEQYSFIYYGFSFQKEYLIGKPNETQLKELSKNEKYDEIVTECKRILDINPVSLEANDLMGYALFKLGKPEEEWKIYQNRYRAIRKVIVYSGDGLTSGSAFKVIYISDEYNILYSYFQITTIYKQSLIGMCDCFEIEPSEFYRPNEIYFDISQEIIKKQEIFETNTNQL